MEWRWWLGGVGSFDRVDGDSGRRVEQKIDFEIGAHLDL